MCHHQYRHVLASQIRLQPFDGLKVQMVGRFIHDDEIWLGQQHLCQKDALALPTRKLSKLLVEVGDAQPAGNLLHFGIVIPGVELLHFFERMLHTVSTHFGVMKTVFIFAHRLGDFVLLVKQNFFDRQRIINIRLLGKVPEFDAFAHAHDPAIGGELPGKNFEKSRFACAVLAHQSHLFALANAKRDVFEEPAIVKRLGKRFCRKVIHANKN